MNEHHNIYTNKYRYKKYIKNIFTEIVYRPENLGASYNSGSSDIQNIRFDYSFYWLRKILWNFMLWYKRPSKKIITTKNTTKIISIISKEMWKIVIGIIILIIGSILLNRYGNDIILFLNLN